MNGEIWKSFMSMPLVLKFITVMMIIMVPLSIFFPYF